jgi:3-deoxy-7-phosphoheptulonate synthase
MSQAATATTSFGLAEGNDLLSTGNVSVAQDTYNQWPAELRARLEAGLARPAAQQPTWPDPERATAVRWMLGQAPPITFPGEVDRAREALGRVATGSAFVLQGGDCAETFAGNTAEHIRGNIRTLLQMAAVLTYGASMPIVTLGRMAGQYAKPRSADVDSTGLPVYRGDMVNSLTADAKGRAADPTRMLRAYANATSTMNMVRAVAASGLSSVDQVHKWNKDFIRTSAAGARHERLAAGVERALRYIEACGVDRRELHAAAVRPVRTHPVDRRTDQAAGRRAHRVRRADRQPDRGQDRPRHRSGDRHRVRRAAQPAQRSRPAHADQQDGL